MMLFITESELTDRYRKTPFATYTVAAETKLTPAARQYLLDHQVEITTSEQAAEQAAEKTVASIEAPTATAVCEFYFDEMILVILDAGRIAAKQNLAISVELFQLAETAEKIKEAPAADGQPEAVQAKPLCHLTSVCVTSKSGELLLALKRIQNYLRLLKRETDPAKAANLELIDQQIMKLENKLIGAD